MLDKEKAIKIIEKLIKNDKSKLSTRFLESHKRVAIFYGEHQIEIAPKEITYIPPTALKEKKTVKVSISKKETKNILNLFLEEKTKRDHEFNSIHLKELQRNLNDD